MERIREYPLDWPKGWKRTPDAVRRKGKFQGTWKMAQQEMRRTLLSLTRTPHFGLIISTNLKADDPNLEGKAKDVYYWSGQGIDSPGVAVSFVRKDKEIILACDKWNRPRDNLKALTATVMGLYKIDYWGCSEAMERAFSGLELQALPAPKQWWHVLGVNEFASEDTIKDAWRTKMKSLHPDIGGHDNNAAELNAARDAGLKMNQGL